MAGSVISNPDSREITALDLESILVRLERKVLSSEADARLLHSSYERAKTSANTEYARTLLLRLEHDSTSIKIQSRRSAALNSLSAQRSLIRRLTDRLHDLERTGDDDDDLLLQQDPDVESENILAEYDDPISSRDITSDQISQKTSDSVGTSPRTMGAIPAKSSSSPVAQPSGTAPLTEPTSVLRNRLFNSTMSRSPTQAHTTSASTSTATAAHKNNNDKDSSPSTTAILESHESLHVDLTASLLDLAQKLKTSTTSFSASLSADTATLDRAVEGLDRNTSGLDAAGRRMGMLRKMSEGKGWLGRMMLYAWIAGLWVVAILLVGVGPKLRF